MFTETSLQPLGERGWRRGLGNMLRKEFGAWWGTATWWKQSLLWLVILNGGILLITTTMANLPVEEANGAEMSATALEFFLIMAGLAPAIGLIVAAQSAIIGEKQAGTAAWILSKPVSRTAFVLAKLIALGVSFLIVGALIPGLVAYVQIPLMTGGSFPLGLYMLGMGFLGLNLLFYLALMIMLGTLFNSRGPVAGIGMAVLLAGGMVPNFWPDVVRVTPWKLPEFAMILIRTGTVPTMVATALAATALLTGIFVVVALLRFERDEF